MVWDSGKPRNRDLFSDVAGRWQSDKSELDDYLQQVVYWGDSTASAGYPRLSQTTAALGTGRVFSVPRSQVSYRGRPDLFYVTDERCLVYLNGSAVSAVVGGPQMVVSLSTFEPAVNNVPLQALNTKVVVSSGTASCPGTPSSLSTLVTFPVTYGAIPMVQVTSGVTDDSIIRFWPPPNASAASFAVGVGTITASTVSLTAQYLKASSGTVNSVQFYWRSIGTVAIG